MNPLSFSSLDIAQRALTNRPDLLRGITQVIIGKQVYHVTHGPTLRIKPASNAAAERVRFALNLPYEMKPGSAADADLLNRVIFQPETQSQPKPKQASGRSPQQSPQQQPRRQQPRYQQPAQPKAPVGTPAETTGRSPHRTVARPRLILHIPGSPPHPTKPAPTTKPVTPITTRVAIRPLPEKPRPTLAAPPPEQPSRRISPSASGDATLTDGMVAVFSNLDHLERARARDHNLLENMQYLVLEGAPYRVDTAKCTVTAVSHRELHSAAAKMGLREPLALTAEATLTAEYNLTYTLFTELRKRTVSTFIGTFTSFEECLSSFKEMPKLSERMRYLVINNRSYKIDSHTRSISALGPDAAYELEILSQSNSPFLGGNPSDALRGGKLIFPARPQPMARFQPVPKPTDGVVRSKTRLREDASIDIQRTPEDGLRSLLRRPGTPAGSEHRRVSFSEEVEETRYELQPGEYRHLRPYALRDSTPSLALAKQRLADLKQKTGRVVTIPVTGRSTQSPADSHIPLINPQTGEKQSGKLHANSVIFYNQRNKPCTVVQTRQDTFGTEDFWQMVMQQKIDAIFDYMPPTTQGEASDNIPRTQSRNVGRFRITPYTTDSGKPYLQLMNRTTGENRTFWHHRPGQWLENQSNPQESRLENTMGAASLITVARAPLICCKRSRDEAVVRALVTSTIMDMDRQCPINQRAHQEMIDTAILKLRKELDSRLVQTNHEYAFLYTIYDRMLL